MNWIKYTGLNKDFLTTQSGMAKCPQCGHVFYYTHGRLCHQLHIRLESLPISHLLVPNVDVAIVKD